MPDEVEKERRRRARLTGHDGYPSTPLRDWPRQTAEDRDRREAAAADMRAAWSRLCAESDDT